MSDIEIARRAIKKPMKEVAGRLGIPEEALEPYGRDKAKLDGDYVKSLSGRKPGHLILVTAINPTKAGEGKTTTTIGLGDALSRLGKKTAIALREPSLGPCFGQKGGATGGGQAQIVPMADINLHFTGDFHAITTAHNLLAAMLDNHIYWGNTLGIDSRRVFWPRVLDMNDRALRDTVVSLGGVANGFPRQARFDITTASEVMAILCLADDLEDLEARLARIVVAETREGRPITAGDLKAAGAMAAVLKDAAKPNLVQTLENNPVLIHGGPFANIAHGCNSVIATRAALALGDYVVTEAGFGADLGAEKFLDIKCRQAGLEPGLAVVVATVRALKLHGGADEKALAKEDVGAVERGLPNLLRHVENLRKFGLPVLVAINRFLTDTPAELELIEAQCAVAGAKAYLCEHWARGGAGAEDLAGAVVATLDEGNAAFRPLYPDDLPLAGKIETIAREIYRASGIAIAGSAQRRLKALEAAGYGKLPVCIAKTQYSFAADPELRGAPTGHTLPIREVRLSAGAGFVVAMAGEIMSMPGLPRVPAAESIRLTADGQVEGIF
ncbi:MAG: formate--tetrahydrofolate ligase [Reyranella sp.]|uniref:formate--tetrahydrofolate ligase n=1 Tax=Reyranella sp. TaxID=1929291 RepID=UPI0011F8569B|nr:formate--tetrahydrofolate ligase [Reyranella sp.]TAJ88582.1 MAG: formate--tetrahydrofolate ligase [Reyranella sp.]TBR29178.1 MAG: formate--tetrahydrofolate ligase [Reyranella sp.]